jgi:hypothetical protein
LSSGKPWGQRAVSGDSSGFVWSLLAIATNPSHFSHAQACGDVAAAVAGTVEAVPGAVGPPPWPGSCVKVAATAAAFTPDDRATSSKAVAAAVADAVVADFAAADEDAALTWSGREAVLFCSQASRFIFLLSLSGRFLLFF